MLRVGIIGTGDIANLNVLGYLHSPDTEVVAVADIDINKAKEKLERWGLRTAKIYADYKKMVDRESLDIVEILTPPNLHFPMTEYCAKAGVAGISVQKPLAHTITDCDKIIQVCREEKIKLKLYENFRFYPVYLKAKELLEQSVIGEPLNFRINTILNGGASMVRGIESLSWRNKVDTCGGGPLVYNDGISRLSMALWLMDQERVEKVYGWMDYFATVMDAPSNIFWKYPSKNPDDPPKYGSMEVSIAANLYYESNYYDYDEFIEISGTKGIMWINQCTAGGNFVSKSPQYPPIVVYVDGEAKSYGQDLPRDWRYSFINSTEHFIGVMKSGHGEPIYNGDQGKNLCIFAKMPYISQQQNRSVFWKEITPDNEKNGKCIVEAPKNVDQRGLTKFYQRKSKDMRKGKKQGLEHKTFKYNY